MSPIYTDMHFKIMPRKKDRGRRPESEKINKNDRTSSVPQTSAEHERLQGPPHNTGAVAAARGWFTYIRLSTCRETNGETLCGAREEAGTVVDEERSTGGSGCEVGTNGRNI